MVLFITTACSFLSFTMDLDDSVADIYGLGITLLLTATAFQFVIATYLPNLPYLTIIDIYIISCFITIFGVIVITAISAIIDLSNDNFFTVGYISFIVFILVQLGFAGYFIYARKQEEKKLTMTYFDSEREEEIKREKKKKEDKEDGVAAIGGKGPQWGVLESDLFMERFKKSGLKCDIPIDSQ